MTVPPQTRMLIIIFLRVSNLNQKNLVTVELIQFPLFSVERNSKDGLREYT